MWQSWLVLRARRVLQLYQVQEMAPTLLPVLATMLHFSPAEVAKCQEAAANAPAGETPDDAYSGRVVSAGLVAGRAPAVQ